MTGRDRAPPTRMRRHRLVRRLPRIFGAGDGVAVRIRRSDFSDPEYVPESDVGIGQRVTGIVRYCLLEQAPGFRKRIVAHSVQQVECLQHEFVSGQIFGVLADCAHQFPLAHLRRDLSYDTDGNSILKGKQFAGVAFVQIRPNDLSRFGRH